MAREPTVNEELIDRAARGKLRPAEYMALGLRFMLEHTKSDRIKQDHLRTILRYERLKLLLTLLLLALGLYGLYNLGTKL